MPNQYTGSFEHKIQERFNCSAKNILEQFASENISYFEAEKRIGVTHGTIRKWARRYGIKLKAASNTQMQEDFSQYFYAHELNMYNFLSRNWKKSA